MYRVNSKSHSFNCPFQHFPKKTIRKWPWSSFNWRNDCLTISLRPYHLFLFLHSIVKFIWKRGGSKLQLSWWQRHRLDKHHVSNYAKKVRAMGRSHLSTPNSVNNWIFNQLNVHAAVLMKKRDNITNISINDCGISYFHPKKLVQGEW